MDRIALETEQLRSPHGGESTIGETEPAPAKIRAHPRSSALAARSSQCRPHFQIAPSASIYIVDDEPHLTELYTTLLENAGYTVRAFNDRAAALAALTAEVRKPDLLITDYRGRSLPVDRFLDQCVEVHPSLRILMASGFSPADVSFSRARPNRFIRKPFTLEEFQDEVRAVLAAGTF